MYNIKQRSPRLSVVGQLCAMWATTDVSFAGGWQAGEHEVEHAAQMAKLQWAQQHVTDVDGKLRAEALYTLSLLYRHGWADLTQNETRAFQLLKQAAALGYARAFHDLVLAGACDEEMINIALRTNLVEPPMDEYTYEDLVQLGEIGKQQKSSRSLSQSS
jgi:TPR repeat protein